MHDEDADHHELSVSHHGGRKAAAKASGTADKQATSLNEFQEVKDNEPSRRGRAIRNVNCCQGACNIGVHSHIQTTLRRSACQIQVSTSCENSNQKGATTLSMPCFRVVDITTRRYARLHEKKRLDWLLSPGV
jgi:hypothetical protein